MEHYIFIYSARSGIIENIPGAISKAVRGKSSCALCNITHGPLFEKSAWKTFIRSSSLPVQIYHSDAIPQQIKKYLDEESVTLPVVLKQGTDQSLSVCVSKEQLERCEGSVEYLKKFFSK